MPKSKSLAERFIQNGGNLYKSGVDPYQEGGRKKGKRRKRMDPVDAVEYITEPILRNVALRRGPMRGTLKEHLDRIRPPPAANRRTFPLHISDLAQNLQQTKNWRKGTKGTRLHTHSTGWYLHGPRTGAPRPGRKVAMIRAYTHLAWEDFHHPGRKTSKHFLEMFKDLRRQRRER